MSSKIDRRSLLSHAIRGMGAVAFSSAVAPFKLISFAKSTPTSGKKLKLWATTDYNDNYRSHGFHDRAMLDQLHHYLSSMGVTRHQWLVDTNHALYEEHQPPGFDILAEAADSAHAHGLEFYALIKPFEGGGYGLLLPNTLPFPENVIALRDLRGIYPRVRPFVARHPHMCMKRRPGTYEVRGPVTSIRLVKQDDRPTRIRPRHLSIWTSPTNNRYSKYEGPVSFHESIEWRPTFPISGSCRILHFDGLQIPEDHRYILIRCSLADEQGDFTNERGNLVELSGPDQENIPCILSTGGPVSYESHQRSFRSPRSLPMWYFQLPEVREIFLDPQKGQVHYQDYYTFSERRQVTRPYTLDQEGYVAIACGKPEYLLGVPHPIYPEVRENWLDMVRYCLDRGVDGINFRHANHTQSPEYWEYGFNEPVIEAAGGNTDYPTIRRINGEAYTQFLREAQALIKSRDKSITIHLNTQMLLPDDRPTALNWIPPNILETHWETWVHEIADDLELRGGFRNRSWNERQALDIYSSVARAAGKPLYFQCNRAEILESGFDGPHHFIREELKMIRNYHDPGVDGYVLYETDYFTRKNEEGEIEGSPALKELIKSHFPF